MASVTASEATMTLTYDRVRQLREENPDWDIRTSPGGHLWAFNWDTTPAQLRAGCVATIDADDPSELAAQLREQDELRRAVGG
jgi:hypothetical protein